MNCPRCHSVNKIDAQFCLECGLRLAPDPLVTPQTGISSSGPNRAQQARSGRSSCLPLLFVGVGGIIILCAVVSIVLYLVKGDEIKAALSKLKKSERTPIVLVIPTDIPVFPTQGSSISTSAIPSASPETTRVSISTTLPTEVVIPTDTPIPEVESFGDDFSSDQGWEYVSSDRYSTGIAEGGIYSMNFWIPGDTEWVITLQPYPFTLPLRDVHVSVVATGMNEAGAYGLVCRCTDRDNLYGFHIANDGRYWIFKMVDGVGTTLVNNSSTEIQGDFHQIEMWCVGDTITAVVDGITLEEIQDGSLSEGNAGLFAQPLGGNLEGAWSFYASFDDFFMENLP